MATLYTRGTDPKGGRANLRLPCLLPACSLTQHPVSLCCYDCTITNVGAGGRLTPLRLLSRPYIWNFQPNCTWFSLPTWSHMPHPLQRVAPLLPPIVLCRCYQLYSLTFCLRLLSSLGVNVSALAMTGMIFTSSCSSFMNLTSMGLNLQVWVCIQGEE